MKCLGLLVLLSCIPVRAADPHLTPDERMKVTKWLEESRKEFLAAMEGITDEQWNWKPAPDRWSVGEVAEHIVLAEAALFGNVKKALASDPSPDWESKTKGKTELIERVMAPRLGKAQAPEPLVPKATMTPAQVRERFERQRATIVEFVTSTDEALKEHIAEHPFPTFGVLNAYQWLIYVPLHTMRHNKQIAEVKAASGYPVDSRSSPAGDKKPDE